MREGREGKGAVQRNKPFSQMGEKTKEAVFSPQVSPDLCFSWQFYLLMFGPASFKLFRSLRVSARGFHLPWNQYVNFIP
jgi:hypothetical protein